MAWWLTPLLFVGSTAASLIVGALTRPRLRPERRGPGTIQFPTAEEGRCIPVVLGTAKVDGPNVLWWGDVQAVVDAGSPSGYQYYAGIHYGICCASPRLSGPSKFGIRNVYFNDVAVPKVSIVVNGSNKAIVFGVGGPPWTTVNLVETTYGTHNELAIITEANMNTAVGATKYRVGYGFNVDLSRNHSLRYATQFSGVENTYTVAIFAPYDYTGPELADQLETVLNAHQAGLAGGAEGTFSVSYNAGNGKFDISFAPIKAGYQHVKLQPMQGADLLAGMNAMIGFRIDQAKTSTLSPGLLQSDYGVFERRFNFAYDGPDATLKVTDPGFTAEGLFGLGAADRTLLVYVGTEVVGSGVEGIPIVDGLGADLLHLYFNAGNLFGTEGGVKGRMDLYLNPATRPPSWYLEQMKGAVQPKWKKLSHAVQRSFYIGNSPYLRNISFEMQSWPDQSGASFPSPNIGDDINPALAIYEILTNSDWGLGRSPSEIDIVAFKAVAQTLANEGFGVSVYLDDPREAADTIEEILRHVDGFRYRDPETGLIGLDLARPGYTVAALPLVDQSIARECVMTRPGWDETRNVVKVRYTDIAGGFVERVEQLQDLANIHARGGLTVVDEFSSSLVTTSANAKKLAERRMKAVSRPMASFTLPGVKRKVWKLREGSLFRLTRPKLGITDLPCRVVSVRSGGPGSSSLDIDAVEDVFGAAWSSWAAPTT